MSDRFVRKANRELEAELEKQCNLIFPAVILVLWEMGWRRKRIQRRLNETLKATQECAMHGVHKSMLEMLEEETGIEIDLEGYGVSYHDLKFLSFGAWDGRPPTRQQVLYMRQRQKKWIAPILMAAVGISLHRVDRFGYVRLCRVFEGIDKYRIKFNGNQKIALAEMEARTTFTRKDINSAL